MASTYSNFANIPPGRAIKPLPRRARSSSNLGVSHNIHEKPNPSSSSDSTQSLPATSGSSARRRSYQTPDTSEIREHLSPPSEVSRTVSQLGRTGSNLSTPDHEISQPLHTLYSDEKILIPTIIGNASEANGTNHTFAYRPATPTSSNQVESNLSPRSSFLHTRSPSDVSEASESCNNSPYDVKDEEAPLEPFFSSAFQNALQNGLNISNKVVTAVGRLSGSSEPSSDLERLSQDARRLGTFQSSSTRTIAVLGVSGEGKWNILQRIQVYI